MPTVSPPRLPLVVGLLLIFLGLGMAASFAVSGPGAFNFRWKAVVIGCIAGLCLVWCGTRLIQKRRFRGDWKPMQGQWGRPWSVVILVLVAGLTTMLPGPFATIRKDNGWTCAYTGSRRGSITWLGFITTSGWYKPSPIEEWLARNGRLAEHNWVRTAGTSYSVFGAICRSHSAAPAVHRFIPELQRRFVDQASTQEIDAFLQVLRNGQPDEARQAVYHLNEQMMKGM